MKTSKSTNPQNHKGHEFMIDQFALDIGVRIIKGNAYCLTCKTPIEANIDITSKKECQ